MSKKELRIQREDWRVANEAVAVAASMMKRCTSIAALLMADGTTMSMSQLKLMATKEVASSRRFRRILRR